MSQGPDWNERFSAWVAEQRSAQGLPSTVEDPDGLDAIASVFLDARRSRSHTDQASA